MNTRKAGVLVALFISVFFPLLSFGKAEAREKRVVKIFDQSDISGAPYFIAYEEGFFKQEGLDVEFVKGKSSSEGLLMLLQGAVDVYEGVVSLAILNAAAQGREVKLVAGSTFYVKGSKFAGIVFLKKNVTGEDAPSLVKSVKGAKIGVRQIGSLNTFILERIFEKNGAHLDTDNLVLFPSFALLAMALQNGAVKAALLTEPFITELKERQEIVAIYSADECPDKQAAFLIFGPNLLKDREAGVKFIKGYLRGWEQYKQGKTKRNIAILKKHTGFAEEQLEKMFWAVINPDAVFHKEQWIFADQMPEFVNKKMIDKAIDPESLVDPTFLKKAQEQLKDTTSRP